MSSEKACLALRLEGPLQSWGFDSQYSHRSTALMPTRSAIGGMCCAALGLTRGSDQEREFLAAFAELRMTAISLPRGGGEKKLPVRRVEDYHTVQNTKTAEGKIKDCHITHRLYLADASFGVVLEGKTDVLKSIAAALADPVWGIWLGRKACLPSSPVLVGLADDRQKALRLLIGDEPLKAFTHQVEAETFSEGRDAIPDRPISFAMEARRFAPRRVKTIQGVESVSDADGPQT